MARTHSSISSCSDAAALRATERLRRGEGHPTLRDEASDRAVARLDRIKWSKGKSGAGAIRLAMQRTMQRHCAVFRTGSLLEEGADTLADVIAMMRDDLGVADRSMMLSTDLIEALELDNMLAQASVSLRSAIGRTESPGRSCTRGLRKTGRREVAQAHAVMARPGWAGAPRLPADPPATAPLALIGTLRLAALG
ncbi:hypothetical protein GWE18_08690 [Bradyrhizobium sp. CSA112]|nr:hypothetical protein [Bradyrhizobium sp. CSA112]